MNNMCPLDLAQALMAYHEGVKGYQPIRFNLRNYVLQSDYGNLPYLTGDSFVPCSSRYVTQFNDCDYDRDKIDYDINNPILMAPLPKHMFTASAKCLVKFEAGFSGLTNQNTGDVAATVGFYVDLLEIPSGKVFDPADSSTYSWVHRQRVSQRVEAGARTIVNLVCEGFFLIPDQEGEAKQYFVAPFIQSQYGARCEGAFLNVEIFQDKID